MKQIIEIDEDLQNALNEYFEGRSSYVGLDNGIKLLEAVKNGKEIKDDISLIHTAGLDNCELCRYYGSHHEVCNYCYKCSLWTEKKLTTENDSAHNLCDSCTNIGCEFQSGIVRTECAFYMPPHIEPDNCGNYIFHLVSRNVVERIIKSPRTKEQMLSVLNSLPPQEPRWIPVSEKLPKDLEPVNITWINHDPEPYYNDIKDKPFTATGVYFNGQWYWWSTLCTDILAEYSHNYDDIIDDAIEVTAWMPLPQAYREVKK